MYLVLPDIGHAFDPIAKIFILIVWSADFVLVDEFVVSISYV
jgi:hypothetical protein